MKNSRNIRHLQKKVLQFARQKIQRSSTRLFEEKESREGEQLELVEVRSEGKKGSRGNFRSNGRKGKPKFH